MMFASADVYWYFSSFILIEIVFFVVITQNHDAFIADAMF